MFDYNDYMIYFISILFDTLGLIVLSKKMLGVFKIHFLKIVLLVLLFTFALMVVDDKLNAFGYLVNTIIYIFMLIITYKEKFINTLFVYLICIIILGSVQTLTLFTSTQFGYDVNNGFVTIAMQSVNLIIYCLICKFPLIKLVYKYLVKNDRVFTSIIISSYIVMFFAVIYYKLNFINIKEYVLLLSLLVLILFLVNLIISVYGLKNQEQREKLKIYNNYLFLVEEMLLDVKSRQHEFNNHIQTISALPSLYDNYEQLAYELRNYTAFAYTDDKILTLLKLDKKVISALIYAKMNQAKAKNIDISLNIETHTVNTKAKDYELVEIMGTLIDNAIEACGGNKILVRIFSEDNRFGIEVMNSFPYVNNESFTLFFERGFSTKKPSTKSRGLGLYNLKNTVINQYNGVILTENININEENYVSISVII